MHNLHLIHISLHLTGKWESAVLLQMGFPKTFTSAEENGVYCGTWGPNIKIQTIFYGDEIFTFLNFFTSGKFFYISRTSL